MKRKLFTTILTLILTLNLAAPTASALSYYGSQGSEVRNIQTRLKSWGYYSGNIDGIYGNQTVEAVRLFQQKNSLTVDGIAGSVTLAAIGLTSGGSSSDTASSQYNSDLELLARLITGEARGEIYEGQVAVAAVVLNRVRHSSFPNTIAGVIYQPQAFTAVDDGQIDVPVQETCRRAAQDALNGWDPSGGAIYYYNPVTATNKWIRSREIIKTIGNHVFCL